jgi:glycosyltransferase involved in cell wall biosynthesis
MICPVGERARVLWITKGLGPGGAERLLVAFAQCDANERHALHAAYLLPWKDQLVPVLERSGVRVELLAGGRVWDPRWLWRLHRLLRRERIDVVHLHSPLVAAPARVAVRLHRRRPALVTTEHNEWTSHHRFTRLVNRWTMPLDDHVFAVSEAVRRSMAPSLAARTEVLHHGVDVASIAARRSERDAARAELGVAAGEVLVGTVANLRSNKDYPTMLRAAASLAADRRPVRFVSVGQGPLADEVRAQRDALELGERFQLLGYREDPIRVLAACDVFCLSSRFEGLPIALLEALALGLPAVVTSVGAMPEVVRDGCEGRVVPAGQPEALAAAIAELEDEALRGRLAASAATRAADYGIGPAVERQQALYDDLAARRRRG